MERRTNALARGAALDNTTDTGVNSPDQITNARGGCIATPVRRNGKALLIQAVAENSRMSPEQREAAEILASGKSRNYAAKRIGVVDTTVFRWCDKPEFKAYVAELTAAVIENAIRASAHNIGEGIGEMCRVRTGLAKRIGVYGEDSELNRDAGLFDIKEHRETVKGLVDTSNSVQKNAREAQTFVLSSRSERVALAAALAGAKASGMPTDPDDVDGEVGK